MAPEVPIRCARPASNTGFMSSARWKAAIWDFTASTMARNHAVRSSLSSGKRSANVTTPMGMDSQALIGSRSGWGGRRAGSSFNWPRSTHESSVEPPPTSTTRAASASWSSRLTHPATDSRASSRGVMTCRCKPVSTSTRAMNSAPLAADRQAWVATARTWGEPRRRRRSAQT